MYIISPPQYMYTCTRIAFTFNMSVYKGWTRWKIDSHCYEEHDLITLALVGFGFFVVVFGFVFLLLFCIWRFFSVRLETADKVRYIHKYPYIFVGGKMNRKPCFTGHIRDKWQVKQSSFICHYRESCIKTMSICAASANTCIFSWENPALFRSLSDTKCPKLFPPGFFPIAKSRTLSAPSVTSESSFVTFVHIMWFFLAENVMLVPTNYF